MKVVGIYGSPRKNGNSDVLLDKALEGAQSLGAEVSKLFARKLNIGGCLECGGCDETGACVIRDDMDRVYAELLTADAVIMAAPVFFYGVPAQLKALIDRCQAMWSKRRIEKSPEQRKTYDRGRGYLIGVGASRGKQLFDGMELTAKYFYDALDMSYEGSLLMRGLDAKEDAVQKPKMLAEAFEFGRQVVQAAK
ncbi:MAG: flavodoxin family protein [Deltaproteobacteria bacterium]|nr:flavodoxin family protein [Deltaproteobacteria bacterium]